MFGFLDLTEKFDALAGCQSLGLQPRQRRAGDKSQKSGTKFRVADDFCKHPDDILRLNVHFAHVAKHRMLVGGAFQRSHFADQLVRERFHIDLGIESPHLDAYQIGCGFDRDGEICTHEPVNDTADISFSEKDRTAIEATHSNRIRQTAFGKPRPALIIQSDHFDKTGTVTVLLISGTLVDAPLIRTVIEPTSTNGLRKRSQVMVDKSMTVKCERIGTVIGRIDNESMLAVNRALAMSFAIA